MYDVIFNKDKMKVQHILNVYFIIFSNNLLKYIANGMIKKEIFIECLRVN
jgi:hypothetical protein